MYFELKIYYTGHRYQVQIFFFTLSSKLNVQNSITCSNTIQFLVALKITYTSFPNYSIIQNVCSNHVDMLEHSKHKLLILT